MTIDCERWDGITGGSHSPAQVVEQCLEFGESHEEWADGFISGVEGDLRHWKEVEASETGQEYAEADWGACVAELRRFLIATLDAARPEGTLCRRVEVSAQAFEFPPDSELESWETVREGAASVKLLTGLLGRTPYTALYSVFRQGRIGGLRHSSYFVAEKLYGIAEFAAVLGGIKANHFRSNLSRGCGQIPRPALEAGGHPIWTHSQVETCKQARLLNARQPRPVVIITENSSADPEAKAYLVSHHLGAMPAHAEHGFDTLVQAKGSVSREYLLRRPIRKDDAAGDVLFIGRLRAKRAKS